jgi:hypothetical protein
MVDEKFVNILWVRIRNVKLCSRSIRYAYFPHCWTISWRFIYKITNIDFTTCLACYQTMCWMMYTTELRMLTEWSRLWNIKTCSYCNNSIITVIADETRNPCIKIIVASAYIANTERAVPICFGPELVSLISIRFKIHLIAWWISYAENWFIDEIVYVVLNWSV